mmetsp:Transcript_45362/g.102665  ORF Transcript_45362/g.102665 Transcript_45362/m.102665 type:complete len:140 (-) Transcript_45362:78-497(-)
MAVPTLNQGLYSDKPDVNVGRLATTVQERQGGVATVGRWREIDNGISFAESETKVTVYIPLPGIQNQPQESVCVWLTERSAEVRILDLHGSNFVFTAPELYAPIDVEGSGYRIGNDKVVLKLAKRASARGWDRWERIRR